MTGDPSAYRQLAHRIDTALQTGGKALLETPGAILSYGDLGRQMRRANAVFAALGLKAGDRAALFSRDEHAIVVLFFAMLRAGITPVLGDSSASRDEMAVQLRIADVAALFADAELLTGGPEGLHVPASRILQVGGAIGSAGSHRGHAELGQAMADAGSLDWQEPQEQPETAVIVFTSGTTAEPKGVMLTYANLIAQLEIFSDVYGFDAETRLLNALALHHVDGMIRGPLAALWFGGTVLRPAGTGPGGAEALVRAASAMRATHFIAVPALLGIILRLRLAETHADAFNGPAFRFVICSADHLDALLWQRFEEAFNVKVVNAYGLSEVVCDALFCGPGADRYQRGTLGKSAGCEARVLLENGSEAGPGETGELCLRGPAVMAGYINAPEASAAVLRDGWFHTGDFVRLAPDGFLHFAGRRKTRIVSAGVTIHPETISAVLLTMPGVEEAVAFGLADPVRGEKVVACAVISPGARLTASDISAFCHRHISLERAPASIHIVSELPRNAAGKVNLEALARKVEGLAAAAPEGQEATIYDLAAECFQVPADSLNADSSPFNTDGWDSLSHVALIESVEQHFDFQMSAMDIALFASLGDLERIVADRSL